MREAKYNLGRLLPVAEGGVRKAESAFGLRGRTLTKATGACGQRTRDRPPPRLHIVYPTGQPRYYLLLREFFTALHSEPLRNSQLFIANPYEKKPKKSVDALYPF